MGGTASPRAESGPHRGRRLRAALAGMLLVAACTSNRPKIEAPSVTVDSVHILRIVEGRASLLIDLQVANPNSFALPIDAVEVEVTLDARPAADAHSVHIDPLPAQGKAKVVLAGQVDATAVATALMTLGTKVPIEYTIKGTATLHDGTTLPFAHKGDIPVARFERLFGAPD